MLLGNHLAQLVSIEEVSAGFLTLPLVLEGVDHAVTLPLHLLQLRMDCTVELQRAGLLQLQMGVSGGAFVGVEQGLQILGVAGSGEGIGAWHAVVDGGGVGSSVLQLFWVVAGAVAVDDAVAMGCCCLMSCCWNASGWCSCWVCGQFAVEKKKFFDLF